MKRLALILISVLTVVGMHSQVVSTRSAYEVVTKEKKQRTPIKLDFYAKAGINIMSTDWEGLPEWRTDLSQLEKKSTVGFNLAFGLMSHFRPTRPSDFYWGAEIGLSQVGGGYNELRSNTEYYPAEKYSDLGAYITPVIGWMKPLSKTVSLDLHFNPGVFFKFKEKEISYFHNIDYNNGHEDWEYVDRYFNLMFKVGAGLWINKFNVDFSYMPVVSIDTYYNSFTNLILSVGYKF